MVEKIDNKINIFFSAINKEEIAFYRFPIKDNLESKLVSLFNLAIDKKYFFSFSNYQYFTKDEHDILNCFLTNINFINTNINVNELFINYDKKQFIFLINVLNSLKLTEYLDKITKIFNEKYENNKCDNIIDKYQFKINFFIN